LRFWRGVSLSVQWTWHGLNPRSDSHHKEGDHLWLLSWWFLYPCLKRCWWS
jgi:hypothetical protein